MHTTISRNSEIFLLLLREIVALTEVYICKAQHTLTEPTDKKTGPEVIKLFFHAQLS